MVASEGDWRAGGETGSMRRPMRSLEICAHSQDMQVEAEVTLNNVCGCLLEDG
jgi:hypothetical protein